MIAEAERLGLDGVSLETCFLGAKDLARARALPTRPPDSSWCSPGPRRTASSLARALEALSDLPEAGRGRAAARSMEPANRRRGPAHAGASPSTPDRTHVRTAAYGRCARGSARHRLGDREPRRSDGRISSRSSSSRDHGDAWRPSRQRERPPRRGRAGQRFTANRSICLDGASARMSKTAEHQFAVPAARFSYLHRRRSAVRDLLNLLEERLFAAWYASSSASSRPATTSTRSSRTRSGGCTSAEPRSAGRDSASPGAR